jgi:hypothetical protein
MKQKLFVSILFFSACFLGLPQAALADVFEIRFYYDSAKDDLRFDRDAPYPVSLNKNKDLPIVEFDDMLLDPGPYEFLFLNAGGNQVEKRQFSPKPGAFMIEVPYYSVATAFGVRRSGSRDFFLTADIAGFSTCDNNGVCELEKGESIGTCLPDCASGKVRYSDQTQQELRKSGGIVRDQETGEVLLREIFGDTQKPSPGPSNDKAANRASEQGGSSTTNVLILVAAAVVLVVTVAMAYLWRRRN